MKKILRLCILISLLFYCTACSKKLTCMGNFSGVDTKIVTKYSNNKAEISSMTFEINVKEHLNLEENPSDEDIKAYAEKIEKQLDNAEDYNDVKVTYKGNIITIKCSYKYDDKKSYTYEENKKQFEDMKLTCN